MNKIRPEYYGGESNPYEVLKVLEAWGLLSSFCLGNVIKYVVRAGKKSKSRLEDLEKAKFYIEWEINRENVSNLGKAKGRKKY